MTEKEKFISEILALVKQPLAGENPIVPTEAQIAELQKADGVEDAILIANNFGWSDYVVQWSLNQPTDQQDSVATALQAALTGQQTNFLECTRSINARGNKSDTSRPYKCRFAR